MISFSEKRTLSKAVWTGLILFVLSGLSLLVQTGVANANQGVLQGDTQVDSKKLSFQFQKIDIRVLLQLIAKSSGRNFIIGDAVKGTVTLSLEDVTWRQALNIVLKTHALASRQVGNVIFISTIEEITNNETKQLQSEETIANLAPLQSRLLRLKYTNAADMAKLLKGQQGNLLTPRGEVAVDTRTNSLIIRDTAKTVNDLVREIRQLDIPARQVLIEARIVNIDTTYESELGVKFGLSDTRHLSGTLAGANQLTQGIAVSDITPLAQRLNFNVPANQLFDGSTPGSIALALARIGPVMLDLELSALEGERHAQVISRPRVVTSNQEKAVIQTGEEIPYQESTSSGATSVVFKKAVLSLEIVPQITPDNKIVLKLKATQDTRGDNIAVGQSGGTPTTIPAINTQAVESNVLLYDNETIVIGGVYRVIKLNTLDRIPFFGSLPVVGALFSHKGEHDEKHELLIFITPKIINASSHHSDALALNQEHAFKE
ncbi:MAG: type IV pilus secretin PilQ [Gammaproteobacteria bacterium]